MANILAQLQTVQNERFACQTSNSIAGAQALVHHVRDSIALYDAANDAAKEGLAWTLGDDDTDHTLDVSQKAEATNLTTQYASLIKAGVQGIVDELKDASETGELDYGTPDFAHNKDAVNRVWKTVAKADKALRTTTHNPVEKQLNATEPARKNGKTKSRQRFEEMEW